MNRKTIAIFIAMVISLIASLLSWKFLVLSAALALLYPLTMSIEKKTDDNELLIYARELRDLCKTKGLTPSLASISKNKSYSKGFRTAACKLLMGHIDSDPVTKGPNENTGELTELISSGVQSGFNIKNSLDMFISGLESKMDAQNGAILGSLNMNTLSKFGVCVFVPLFGGIGASILSGSTAILGSLHSPTAQFEFLIAFYTGVMSFVMSLFGSGGLIDNINGSFRATIIAGGIIKASSVLIAYAI